MFRVSYINEDGKILHKGNFESDTEAYKWIEAHKEITPLKLLVWSDIIQCFDTFKEF